MIQCNDYNSVRNTWDLRKNLFSFFLVFGVSPDFARSKILKPKWTFQPRNTNREVSVFPSSHQFPVYFHVCTQTCPPDVPIYPLKLSCLKKLPHYTPTICCSSKPLRQSVSVPNNCPKHLTVHTNDNDDLKLTNFQFKCPLCAKIV